MSEYGWHTTTNDILQGVDLSGRKVLVTGGASGIGEETCRALSAAGATVLLGARSVEKADEAMARIRDSVAGAVLEPVIFDLADLASIRRGAAAVLEHHSSLDILINNAGVMACPLLRTVDGFEMQFGTNHLGHFLLTGLLLPALLAGNRPRVVNLSSAGHKFAAVNLEDPNYLSRPYDKWQSYGESKTANVLFSVELNRRFSVRGLHANAVHPGAIGTNLGRHMEQEDMAFMGERMSDAGIVFKTVEQGAATSVWAATAPELEGRGGLYLEDCHIAQQTESDVPGEGVMAHALDADAAARLWTLSEQLTGESVG